MNTSEHKTCPCGSDNDFASCCGAIINGQQVADTAEALMRSRYTAHVIDDLNYQSKSWHSSTRPKHIGPNEDGLVWSGLEILATEAGQPGDDTGEVEFIAHFILHGKGGQIHERSQFRRENGEWRYLDGKLQKGQPVRNEVKVGRNDPCPCGSGKKYKKCCMS